MTRAIYVPAGVPIWTGFAADHSFSHLDVHLHQDRLMRFLSPSLGSSAALAALRRPVEVQDTPAIDAIAPLLLTEIVRPTKHAVFAESLVGSMVAGLLDIRADDDPASGGLTQAQMKKLTARFEASLDRRLSIAEMAEAVGLSESWFASVFKTTTGTTPLQWQLRQRIDLAQKLLIESDLTLTGIAAQLGFSDQAHLTRIFRKFTGEPPAAWRRSRLG